MLFPVLRIFILFLMPGTIDIQPLDGRATNLIVDRLRYATLRYMRYATSCIGMQKTSDHWQNDNN